MNLLTAAMQLLTRERSHKLNVAHLDDRLLDDIGLARIDIRSGRGFKKSA
jgi:uncharacterized protein YjiS (DUF1127 family)